MIHSKKYILNSPSHEKYEMNSHQASSMLAIQHAIDLEKEVQVSLFSKLVTRIFPH